MVALSPPRVDDALLQEVVQRVLSVGQPAKIVLFGSYARGTPHPQSDLDLLIIEEHPEGPPRQRETRYYMALSKLPVPKDIVVYTPDEAADWANVPLAFVTTALREGRTLYERGH